MRALAGDTLAALRTGFAADPGALAAVDGLADPVERRWLSLDQLVAGRGSGSAPASSANSQTSSANTTATG